MFMGMGIHTAEMREAMSEIQERNKLSHHPNGFQGTEGWHGRLYH